MHPRAPPPAPPAPGRIGAPPIPRGRLRGAHSDVPGSHDPEAWQLQGGGLRWLGLRVPAGRGPSSPSPPSTPSSCPRPPRYLPAEPHNPVQLGLILKQIPELPGAEDPKAPRAAGLRPRPRRPGPVHTARPRPQLGCWLGPIGPAPPRLRSGSAPGSGLRLQLRPRAALFAYRRQGAPRPLLKGPPPLAGLGVGQVGGGPHPEIPRQGAAEPPRTCRSKWPLSRSPSSLLSLETQVFLSSHPFFLPRFIADLPTPGAYSLQGSFIFPLWIPTAFLVGLGAKAPVWLLTWTRHPSSPPHSMPQFLSSVKWGVEHGE